MSLLFISRAREYHLAVARRCTRYLRRFFFLISRTDLSRGPSPRSGKCHCRFHRAIRNWLVTSNWRRRYSECTCGTMNSDPPTTPTSTTTTIMPRSGPGGGRVQRGGGRTVGPRSRGRREIVRYHHAGTSVCKATRISWGDIDIATSSEVLLRVTSNGA